MYRPTLHHFLTNDDDPVNATVPVAGSKEPQSFRLRPLDLRRAPKLRESFDRVCDLMSESRDANILRPFLEELRISNRKLSPSLKIQVTRAARRLGRLGLVADLIRHDASTGFEVCTKREARNIMVEVLRDVIERDWTAEALERGCKNAEAVFGSYERRVGARPKCDARLAPDVFGMALSMFASRAFLVPDAANTDREVELLVRKVLAHWNARQLPAHPNVEWDTKFVSFWAPTWQGAQMALRVLGKESLPAFELSQKMGSDVAPFLNTTLKALQSADEAVRQRSSSVVGTYDAMSASLKWEAGSAKISKNTEEFEASQAEPSAS